MPPSSALVSCPALPPLYKRRQIRSVPPEAVTAEVKEAIQGLIFGTEWLCAALATPDR